MNLDNVFIAEFNSGTAITYPEKETPGSADRRPEDLIGEDYDFNHGVKKYTGYRIHHIETLQPVIYYLRFLIDKECPPPDHVGTLKRYVVSCRINLNNFCHSDFLELTEKVIDKVKSM